MANDPITSCGSGDVTATLDVNGAPVSDANPMPVELTSGDIELGAVEIKSGDSDNRAQVDTPAALTSTDLVLGVHDPGPVNNQSADGAAVAGNPVRIAGKDGGGLTQDIITDTTGNQVMVGPAADGAAVAGAPVRIGAKDGGGLTQDLLSDTSGNLNVGGNVATNAADSGNPVKIGGVFLSVPETLDTGDRGNVLLDVNGRQNVTQGTLLAGEDLTNNVMGTLAKPVASATYSGTSFVNFGAATAISVKAAAGNLLWVTCTNENAAVRFLQIHNKASAPAAAEVPVLSFPIPAGTATQPAVFGIGVGDWGSGGQFLATGIAIGISTTEGTYTAATASEHTVNGGSV